MSTPFAYSQGTSQIHHQPLSNVTFTHTPTAGLFLGIPSYLSNTHLTEVKVYIVLQEFWSLRMATNNFSEVTCIIGYTKGLLWRLITG